MLRRIIAVGAIALTATLFLPTFSYAAGASGWMGGFNQPKRPVFRPWTGRSPAQRAASQWRPQQRAAGFASPAPRYQAAARQPALIEASPRYSAPASRAFERSTAPGIRFRPNGRAASAPVEAIPVNPPLASTVSSLHSQFRPKPSARLSYEEFQANARAARQSWSLHDQGHRWPSNPARRLPAAPWRGW